VKRAALLLLAACGGGHATTTTPPAPPAPPVAKPAVVEEPVPLGPLPRDPMPLRESLDLAIDPAKEGYSGTAEIALHVEQRRTGFWLHGRGLDVTSAALVVGGHDLPARWSEHEESGVARVETSVPFQGDVSLRIAFRAKYDPNLVGVYRTAGAVFSKFEAIYARRAFPCFDEPSFKIPFRLALEIPGGLTALSNTPIEAQRGPRIVFAETKPLPTYLVAFAVGNFDRETVQVGDLTIGGVAMAGRGKDTRYALAQEQQIVAEQAKYFGTPFPFPKLDLVAVPDFQSGAMENAGAITFRDGSLLVDDKITTLPQKIGVTSVVAHETAHQWFGDLVTMRWWDDLWLNEGFATFLATRTLKTLDPDFGADLGAVDDANGVMNLDSLAGARRVREPIKSTNDITNAFDGITYEKGAAILAMLEHYVGDDVFQRGVQDYLRDHAYGNATTQDLVAALSNESGKDLAPLTSSFLDQVGVPQIAVTPTCKAGAGTVELAQSRWIAAGGAPDPGTRWVVPVCVRASVKGKVADSCTVLDGVSGTIALPGCADWVFPNAGATGYYRFTLPPADLAKLLAAAKALSPAERLSLARNVEAGLRSAALPADAVLRAMDAFARDPHGTVAGVPVGVYDAVIDEIAEGKAKDKLRAHVRGLYAARAKALGWRNKPEPPADRILRGRLLQLLALDATDPAVFAQGAAIGEKLLGLHGAPDPSAADPDTARIAIACAIRRDGTKAFDAALAQFVASTDAQVRARLLVAMTETRDPVLAGRALDLALDPRLRANERITPLRDLLDDEPTRALAWQWLEAHFDDLAKLLPDRFPGYIPGFVHVCHEAQATQVEAFFAPRAAQYTGMPRNLALALEAGKQCRARALAQLSPVQAFAGKK
jgi:alanyl aminopeptidase